MGQSGQGLYYTLIGSIGSYGIGFLHAESEDTGLSLHWMQSENVEFVTAAVAPIRFWALVFRR